MMPTLKGVNTNGILGKIWRLEPFFTSSLIELFPCGFPSCRTVEPFLATLRKHTAGRPRSQLKRSHCPNRVIALGDQRSILYGHILASS